MFDPAVTEAAKAHALAAYPDEAVGFVVDGAYEPQENVAMEPGDEFAVSDVATLAAFQRGLQAVIHSHPNGNDFPSRRDMEQQAATAVPWGIVPVRAGGTVALDPFFWGDTVPREELVGRQFRHGVTDCYALVRDYFRLTHGIALPDYPRDDNWWHAGQNLYTENFANAGFSPVEDGPKEGDVGLMQIHSPVVNHACVYVGEGGLILHHLHNRLSRREPAFSWRKFIVRWVRHKELA